MNPIHSFLEKYFNFTPPALVRARAIIKTLNERFGIECSEDDVTIRGSIAYIRCEGMLKSEIALNKAWLLGRIKELGGGELLDLK